MLSDTAPFHAGSTIFDPRYFIGYQEQLDIMTARAINVQPTSLNVVGDKHIGKSSLLQHFCQTYEQRIESRGDEPNRYLAVYLDLQQVNCQHKSSFYRVVAQELSKNLEQRYSWFGQPRRLIQALKANNFNTESFYQAIVQFQDVGILPILCLDKIEALFKYSAEFNDDFYDNLRSLMNYRGGALMLVIASEKNIEIYRRQKKLTSSFFIDAHVMMLKGLTDNEARDLVRLPKTTIPGKQEALSENEQQTALEWGGKNPYLLQLAGLCLWDAQRLNRNIDWAKRKFNEYKAKTDRSKLNIKRIRQLLGQTLQILIRLPANLIRFAEDTGNLVGKAIATGIGLTFILLCILAVNGSIPWTRIPKQLGDFLCSTLSSVLGEFCEDDSTQ